jgi:hypothetical protein
LLPKAQGKRTDLELSNTVLLSSDFAELCWALTSEDWQGQQIADELGWDRTRVVRHQSIKTNLHDRAWGIARFGVPTKSVLAHPSSDELGTENVPNGTLWAESHFRSFLKYLPCPI